VLVEFADHDGVGARGKVAGDVALETAQQEGGDATPKSGGGRLVTGEQGFLVAVLEVGAAAEQSPVGKMHLAPQLARTILDRRA
jgi:hypothetical protein